MNSSCYISFGKEYIYCNSNGYPSIVGQLLQLSYNNIEKIKELMRLGDIFILGENINPNFDLPHDYYNNNFQRNVTVFYSRHLGESVEATRAKSLDNNFYTNSYEADFIYRFNIETKKWEYSKIPFKGWKKVLKMTLEEKYDFNKRTTRGI